MNPAPISTMPPPAERARRILVVDGDPTRREALTRGLRFEGYFVECIEDADEVVQRVRSLEPDLVLLDVHLPGQSGLEICAELRMLPESRMMPIILTSHARMDEQSVVRGLLSGADDYITAPGRLAELRARVRVQLRNLRDRELLEWARSQRASFKRAALNDPLTGIPNRRYADDALAETRAASEPFSLLLIDVDHFKSVNDTYGHGVGDEVLKAVARALARQIRRDDVVARFGGEEFLVLLRGLEPALAASVAERFRRSVEALLFEAGRAPERVTVSIGVAVCDGQGAPRPRSEELLRLADDALYEAKRTGRNRVVCRSVSGDDSQPEIQNVEASIERR